MSRILFLFCLVVWAFPSFAWNKPTHMVTASIAYDELKRTDPSALATVIRLLKAHPDFVRLWEPEMAWQNIAIGERARFLLMMAARWPDDIRRRIPNDHPKWHYVNIPIIVRGQRVSSGQLPRTGENILTGYKTNLALLRGTGTRAQKAVALCWVFHLVGDVHQPLHTTTLISEQFPAPQGDRGGTRFYIRAGADRATINLHSLWDNLVFGSNRFQGIRNKSILLRKSYPRTKVDGLKETDSRFRRGPSELSIEWWAERESYPLALSTVYNSGKVVMTGVGRPSAAQRAREIQYPFVAGSTDERNGAVLPPYYLERAKRVAEYRVVQAGYRLADLLKRTL